MKISELVDTFHFDTAQFTGDMAKARRIIEEWQREREKPRRSPYN